MMNPVVDQAVRDELLTVNKSYIVQAPAGSGKTELLTQRILALLAVVDKPENVLAITFTRKAAAEMKSRVLSALELAQKPEPHAEHEKQRWHLARKVLQRDKQHNWRIYENTGRLNITTIDSLSATLSSALPLLSQTGALPKIADNAFQYYEEAADNLMASISQGDETADNIQTLLKHKDNNFNQVNELMAQMLAKRLQWFSYIKEHARKFDDSQLFYSLKTIVTDKLQEIYHCLPNNIVSELPDLLNQASQVLSKSESSNKPYLTHLDKVDALKLPQFSDLANWKAIAELFLKANGKAEVLSSFTVRNGFPTVKDARDDEERINFKKNKTLVTEISKALKQSPEICDLLLQISLLPDEFENSPNQQSLKAAVALLPVAVAHLKLVFSRYNIIDFPELSLASLDALGHPDMPTDLALAFDYRLEHILIDEFQDTSSPQIELIKLLTSAWQIDSGRSLFLVGDPMQSIYRFRDANVSLFMQICQHGIGDIQPIFRQLKVNFRSNEKIVNWINQEFSRIMPEQDNVTFSAVSYADSVAFNQSHDDSNVNSFITLDAKDNLAQAEKVIEIVKNHLKENQNLISASKKVKSLAILARSRNHFKEIIQLLNQYKIVFQAVEIDRLSEKIIVKDLTNLAFALTDEYDELSWSACLRSPWFSLDLESIKQILQHTEKTLPFSQRIISAYHLISETSKIRCEKILPILIAAINQNGRKPFRQWLLGCFKAIGALAQLDFESDFDDLIVCVDKLNEVFQAGGLYDRKFLFDELDKLFAAANPVADGQVQIMTIHKSKGLEFDTVILPRLDSGKRAPEQALLKWTEVLDSNGQAHNLLAISKETGKAHDSIYRYISFLDTEKSKYEDQRLLYVAATRAKQKLYLLANLNSDPKSELELAIKAPTTGSFLSMLWLGMAHDFQLIESKVIIKKPQDVQGLYQSRYIKQVALKQVANYTPETPDIQKSDQVGLATAIESEYIAKKIELASVIGTCLHAQLQWLSQSYSDSFELPANWLTITRNQLGNQHVFKNEAELEFAAEKVMLGLTNTLSDDFGRHIISTKNQADCELVLHKKLTHGSFLTRIIDRTFVHQGKRWIIDYKSSQPEKNQTLQAFLEKETAEYLLQLTDYFNLFLQLEKRPVVAGLYFPLLQHFEKVLEN